MLKGTVFPLICIATMRLSVMHRESRKEAHDKVVRKLQLTTKDGDRFFEVIHASPNRFLYRDNFRMDSETFDPLFELYQDHIDKSVRDRREVLAVALNWIGTAATCRAQEVLSN
ncbi:hypothetical protein PHYPSEUDO_011750 [Phytophthora pseudosyringae]|uniref:Uncharacterized protein n=1 Tax=Phytophthora pseudosyringae TaxID=221518 RepID=A0A8T1VAS4_9STRA|nr:hypothetical protein PHYPSEUDO_011750 [Phytophthora pseudosyringae]